MDFILNLLKSLSYIDYIAVLLLLATIPAFFYLGIRKLYKFIFGTVIGFSFFSGMNLIINSLSTTDLGSLNGLISFFVDEKMAILKFAFYMIPVFAILVFGNRNVEFTSDEGESVYSKIKLAFFAPFSLIFLFGVIFAIYQNKFIFGIDSEFINYLHSDAEILNFFNILKNESQILSYIMSVSHVISLLGFLLIFYILTIGGLVRLFVGYVSIQIVIRKSQEGGLIQPKKEQGPVMIDEMEGLDLSALNLDEENA